MMSIPLQQAELALQRIHRQAHWSSFLPIPFVAAGAATLHHFDPLWWSNPFLVLVLGLFTWGQILALRQLRSIVKRCSNDLLSLRTIQRTDSKLGELRDNLAHLPMGHVRDLVLSWLDSNGRPETLRTLWETAADRRSMQGHRSLNVHAHLNRNVLKLGFLGTLIGLLLTFSPMKRAVLGLSDSNGELGFIRDIAQAIDHDAYAILATLIATGFSLFIEALTVQVLERILSREEDVDTYLSDWSVLSLLPRLEISTALTGESSSKVAASEAASALTEQMAQNQALLQKQMDSLAKTIEASTRATEQLAHVQKQVGQRVEELASYEQQYRSFLATKTDAAIPGHLKPKA